MESFFEALRAHLDDTPGRALSGEGPSRLKPAAVLVPFFSHLGRPHLLFTERPLTLRKHAGQISFPGGGRDATDESLVATALRETEEELGLPGARVEVIGRLDEVATITGFRVTPFVGVIPDSFAFRPSPQEIERILELPVADFLGPPRVERFDVLGATKEVYFYDLGPDVIWGLTARIVHDLLAGLAGHPALEALREA